jgi:hypothetical protein
MFRVQVGDRTARRGPRHRDRIAVGIGDVDGKLRRCVLYNSYLAKQEVDGRCVVDGLDATLVIARTRYGPPGQYEDRDQSIFHLTSS